jgi:hypothetical protein
VRETPWKSSGRLLAAHRADFMHPFVVDVL